jgi:hypothetical protein
MCPKSLNHGFGLTSYVPIAFERRVQAIIVKTNSHRLQVVKHIKHYAGDGSRIRELGTNTTVSYQTCQGYVKIGAFGATYL